MVIKENKYSIYDADMFNDLDTSLFHSNIRWSVDGSEFIVEWKDTPLNSFLTHSEASEIMRQPEWVYEEEINL